MKVTIKGGTVALLSLDDTHARARNQALLAATEMAAFALAFVHTEPTTEQRAAWRSLSEADRENAAHRCTQNVPALLTITDEADGKTVRWEVTRAV